MLLPRFREAIDGTQPDLYRKGFAVGDHDVRFRRSTALRLGQEIYGELAIPIALLYLLIHRCVPPTVISSIRMVGRPTPTGTDCPSFPQVPMPSSSLRSCPTIETLVRISGPLPINVAPLTGLVTFPPSIK